MLAEGFFCGFFFFDNSNICIKARHLQQRHVLSSRNRCSCRVIDDHFVFSFLMYVFSSINTLVLNVFDPHQSCTRFFSSSFVGSGDFANLEVSNESYDVNNYT